MLSLYITLHAVVYNFFSFIKFYEYIDLFNKVL